MQKKQLKSYRFYQNDIDKLELISEFDDVPKTRVLENLINQRHQEIQMQKRA